MSHPIAKVAQAALQKGEDGRFFYDADAIRLLEHGLLKYGGEPSIADAVVELVEFAMSLHQNADSPAAAGSLMKVLAENRSHMPALSAGVKNKKLAVAFEQMQAFSGESSSKSAPKFGEAPPPDSVKASSFLEPVAEKPKKAGSPSKAKLRRGIPKP